MGSLIQIFKDFFGEYWFVIAISIPIILYFSYYILRYLYLLPYRDFDASSLNEDFEITFYTRKKFYLRLARKVVTLFLLIYSASFLSVVLPSDPHDPVSGLIYTIGAIIYLSYAFHVVTFIIYYRKVADITIFVSNAGISWKRSGVTDELDLRKKIEIYERLNVLHLSDGDKQINIPFFLIPDKTMRGRLVDTLKPLPRAILEKGRQGLEVFESVIIALVLAMHIRQFAVQAFYIPSGSMEMTLRIGDHLLVDKLSLGPFFPPVFSGKKATHLKFLAFSDIKRGEIIVFKPPIPNEHREFIKRVIALPGETFEIKNGKVYINDKEIREPYLNDHGKEWKDYYKYLAKSNPAFAHEPSCPRINHTEYLNSFNSKVTVPAGHYLMMGDHRDNSSDSRAWGFVSRENIRGRAWILYFNYYDFIVNFDWSRFGFIH